jgi:hypothetical protein
MSVVLPTVYRSYLLVDCVDGVRRNGSSQGPVGSDKEGACGALVRFAPALHCSLLSLGDELSCARASIEVSYGLVAAWSRSNVSLHRYRPEARSTAVFLSVCLSVCLFVCLFVCLYVCLSVCLSVVCLFVCRTVCLYVCRATAHICQRMGCLVEKVSVTGAPCRWMAGGPRLLCFVLKTNRVA